MDTDMGGVKWVESEDYQTIVAGQTKKRNGRKMESERWGIRRICAEFTGANGEGTES
jgi:hypothetical protein